MNGWNWSSPAAAISAIEVANGPRISLVRDQKQHSAERWNLVRNVIQRGIPSSIEDMNMLGDIQAVADQPPLNAVRIWTMFRSGGK